MKKSKKINRALGLSQDNIFRKLFRIVTFVFELIFIRLYNKFSRNSGDIPSQFHSLYYSSPERTWKNTRWMGYRTMKCPLDLWVYQEILYEIKPDIVIETGVNEGGGAAFLTSIMDSIGKGRLITVDIEILENLPVHRRITYLQGSSTDKTVVQKISDINVSPPVLDPRADREGTDSLRLPAQSTPTRARTSSTRVGRRTRTTTPSTLLTHPRC